MGREAERSALETFVLANWPSEYGPLAIVNVPFKVPANGRWAQMSILTYSTERVSLGPDYIKRTLGSLQFDLFHPQDSGSSPNKSASDFLENFFEERKLILSVDEVLEFQTPESRETTGVQERQEGTNDNWFRTIVDCPFRRDEVKRK